MSELLPPIEIDEPSSFLGLIDECAKEVMTKKAFHQLSSLNLEYIDDAVRKVSEFCDLAELFWSINKRLLDRNLRCFHATRLTERDANDIQKNGFRSLNATNRISNLPQRIREYCEENGVQYKERDIKS
jgi:hypothetical protein